MKFEKKGFTLIAVLSLLVIISLSAVFLGQMLSQLKSTKLKTQARVSSLGYEDSMSILIVSNVVRQIASACTGDVASLNNFDTRIPGTQVDMKVESMNPSSIANGTGTVILKTNLSLLPDVPRAVSEQFIDSPAKVTFRLEFLEKSMNQSQKIFDQPVSCVDFRALASEKKQIKVAFLVEWTYRGKNLSTQGIRLLNLQEVGL